MGTDHDTAAFAVESLRRWWYGQGQAAYPYTRRLLITADAGGSNGYRTRAWKAELAGLAVQTGLEITVCHFPPGTSKWNRIEHRLFCHITHNWRGRPLTSHEVIVQTIAATTTRTGLTVHADLDTTAYATGVRIEDRQMDALPLHRHDWHGDWNYTLLPHPYTLPTADAPLPFDEPTPQLAWLCHPALTGLSPQDWDALLARLTTLHDDQRESDLDHRRGHRPRIKPATGRRPSLTLADRLLATVLHYRLALPQTAIATLFTVWPETINRRIRDIRQLLQTAGHIIQPTDQPLVLAQTDVSAKTNEVPRLKEVLAGLDLRGAVLTVDALHTVRATATWLHSRGADFVMTVKENTPKLFAALDAMAWDDVPIGHESTERAHGRITRRTIQTLPAPPDLPFPHTAQAFLIERSVTDLDGRNRTAVAALGVASLTAERADPARLAALVRGHWAIESLHWIRDTLYREDDSTARTRSGPRVMAALRNLAVGAHRLAGRTDITEATRWAGREMRRPFQILNLDQQS